MIFIGIDLHPAFGVCILRMCFCGQLLALKVRSLKSVLFLVTFEFGLVFGILSFFFLFYGFYALPLLVKTTYKL